VTGEAIMIEWSPVQSCAVGSPPCALIAQCETGWSIVGGGFDIGVGGGVSTGGQVLASQPFKSIIIGDGWLVRLKNNGASAINFQAWGICIQTVPSFP
jgi:hypothetical protein